MRTRPRRVLPTGVVAVLLTLGLSGCVSAATEQAAKDLAERIGVLPGVSSASLKVNNYEGNAGVLVRAKLAPDVTVAQIVALRRPVAAASTGEHPLRDVTVYAERGRAPDGVPDPSRVRFRTRDTASQVRIAAERLFGLGSVLGDRAAVQVLASSGPIDVIVADRGEDPVSAPAARVASYRGDLSGVGVNVKTPGVSPQRQLWTPVAATAAQLAQWHRLATGLVRLPGGDAPRASLVVPGSGRVFLAVGLSRDPDVAPEDITPARYRTRLWPMITANLDLYLRLGPAVHYTLETHSERSVAYQELISIEADRATGAPVRAPGWNELALDYVRDHR